MFAKNNNFCSLTSQIIMSSSLVTAQFLLQVAVICAKIITIITVQWRLQVW